MEPVEAAPGEIEDLLASVAAHDGQPGLSEHKQVRLGGATDAVVGTWGNDDLLWAVGVAVSRRSEEGRHWSLEIAVDPRRRTATTEVEAIAAGGRLVPHGEKHSLWAWRDDQLDAARSAGYEVVRTLLRMETDLGTVPRGPFDVDAEIGVIDAERDLTEVVAVNDRAFAGHREAPMGPDEFLDIMRRPWYDPAGFLVAWRGGRLVGFCWTKPHPGGVGEIYVIAVDPDAHGRGLGRALLAAGFAHLARERAHIGMLWVDGENRRAVDLYRGFGMETVGVNRELDPQETVLADI